MNRRGFLGFLGAAVVGAALDPEKLLWVPGRKLISIPPAPKVDAFSLLEIGDIIEIEGRYAVNPVTRQIAINPVDGSPIRQLFCVTKKVEGRIKAESRIDLWPYTERGKVTIGGFHPAKGMKARIG